jgi:hypothetical protein
MAQAAAAGFPVSNPAMAAFAAAILDKKS